MNGKNIKYLELVIRVVVYFNEESKKAGGKKHKIFTKGVYDRIVRWGREGYELEEFEISINEQIKEFVGYSKKNLGYLDNISLPVFLKDERFERCLESGRNKMEIE